MKLWELDENKKYDCNNYIFQWDSKEKDWFCKIGKSVIYTGNYLWRTIRKMNFNEVIEKAN